MTEAERTVRRPRTRERGPDPTRTVIERGPKGKRSVAFAIDWPGWSRGARSADLALETLESYRERYRPVAVLAGMAREFDAAGPLEIVEDKRPTSRRCARTTPGRSNGACARGRCRSSSDTLPTTHSTMPGRWRTRTSLPRTGTEPTTLRSMATLTKDSLSCLSTRLDPDCRARVAADSRVPRAVRPESRVRARLAAGAGVATSPVRGGVLAADQPRLLDALGA